MNRPQSLAGRVILTRWASTRWASTLCALTLSLSLVACSDEHDGHDEHDHGAATPSKRDGVTAQKLYHVAWSSQPEVLPFNEPFTLSVRVMDATSHALLPEATITLDATMPDHGHGMNTTPRVTPNQDGTFRVEGMLFHMRGSWQLEVQVAGPAGTDRVALPVACCS